MRARIATTLLVAVLSAGAARAQRIESVLGSKIRLELRGADPLSGELLATQGDSLWLLPARGGMRRLPLADVAGAQVPRGGMRPGTVMVWAVIGGVVSGGLLTAACSSVESDCGAVFPAVLVSWSIVGGVMALATGPSWRTLPADAAALAPYARFPQGLPPDYVPATAGP